MGVSFLMVNRYLGNTGRVQKVIEPNDRPAEISETREENKKIPLPKHSGNGISHSFERIINRFTNMELEQEDLLLLLILFLLYRESGDRQFLITLIAFLVL